ncbi:unnamed protein product [Ilex paraguariensis]|uniref:RRM domain-containing protein n=1 Tax=Ilex paraguariensis TaxID=185542 RepID=A0ABC8U7J5_9AQUA
MGREVEENENNNKDDIDGTAATKKMMRIYIGGLGLSVTENDLIKTFSPLGKVESADIVRTNGRSFAYLDFLPSSEKALAKLFSTYNGCMWKGGRLRLEKAKEHYLLRLRHEWEEDAELANKASSYSVDAAENFSSMEKPNKVPNTEKVQLRIFFPKLNKVKSVPFSGTGKHKYSFQRVEVPSFPIHFCDCEDHSDPCHVGKEKPPCDGETGSGGIKDEEINMMRSVMSKLFENDNCSKGAFSDAGLAKEGDNSFNSVDGGLGNETEEDHVSDEDNLILNMVAGGDDRLTLFGSHRKEKKTATQELRFNGPEPSEGTPASKMHDSKKRKIITFNKKEKLHKKQKLHLSEESDEIEIVSAISKTKGTPRTHPNESATDLQGQSMKSGLGSQQSTSNLSWSQKSKWRDLVGDRGSTTFHMSQILPSVAIKDELPRSHGLNVPYHTEEKKQEHVKHGILESQPGQSKEPKDLAEAPAAQSKVAAGKSARGASWLKESTWTQLVGDANRCSFSITQILPDLSLRNKEPVQSNSMDAANSMDGEHCNLIKSSGDEPIGNSSKALGVYAEHLTVPCGSNEEQSPTGVYVEQTNHEKKSETVTKKVEVSGPTFVNNPISVPKHSSTANFKIGETCSFMRSAASMREWMTAKAALSGSLKKKDNQK